MNERMSKANLAFRDALKGDCIQPADLTTDESITLRTAFLNLKYGVGRLNPSDWDVAVAEGGFKLPESLVDELINAIPSGSTVEAKTKSNLIKKLKPAEPK